MENSSNSIAILIDGLQAAKANLEEKVRTLKNTKQIIDDDAGEEEGFVTTVHNPNTVEKAYIDLLESQMGSIDIVIKHAMEFENTKVKHMVDECYLFNISVILNTYNNNHTDTNIYQIYAVDPDLVDPLMYIP